jgi:hypothetical protein
MKKIERIEYATELFIFKDVISPLLIREFNEEIDSLRTGSGGTLGKLLNKDVEAILSKLRAHSEYRRIEKFCRRVSRLRFSTTFFRNPPDDGICYIRFANALSDNDSHRRHFDSYLMTILIPIKTVELCSDNGDLIFYRKKNYSTSVAGNIVRKTLTKIDQLLPLTYRKKRTEWQLRKKLCQKILCETGNIYFFNGYNTKHCNLSVSSGERRTLLVHAYDPNNSLGLSSFLRLSR